VSGHHTGSQPLGSCRPVPSTPERAVKTLPSYVFAALGVALVVLGIATLVWGDGALIKFFGALVAVIGVVQLIFGGVRRTEEGGEPHVLRGPSV
jgi:hypothetical protein